MVKDTFTFDLKYERLSDEEAVCLPTCYKVGVDSSGSVSARRAKKINQTNKAFSQAVSKMLHNINEFL